MTDLQDNNDILKVTQSLIGSCDNIINGYEKYKDKELSRAFKMSLNELLVVCENIIPVIHEYCDSLLDSNELEKHQLFLELVPKIEQRIESLIAIKECVSANN